MRGISHEEAVAYDTSHKLKNKETILMEPKFMVAEVVETVKGTQTDEAHTHWDIIEVWDNRIHSDEIDRDDHIEIGVDVAQDTWSNFTNKDTLTETGSTMDWKIKKESDAMSMNDQIDEESDIFWDALSDQEPNSEDEMFWDAIMNLDSSLKEYNCPSTEDESSWKVETNVDKDTSVNVNVDDDIS